VVVGDTVGWLERGVRDVPHPGERIAAGHPICTLVVVAATAQGVLDELEEQAARLRAELEPRVEVTAGG
jgi:predicted ATP-grasp superfamily ATP-dependent carboligase